eukprot:6046834-Prorocentrum_lima.AAC.1
MTSSLVGSEMCIRDRLQPFFCLSRCDRLPLPSSTRRTASAPLRCSRRAAQHVLVMQARSSAKP